MNSHNYYGFADWADVLSQFETAQTPEPELVYAVYNTPPYEGSADVVFRREGQWFHNNGGHCSCYGLEDQWTPVALDPQVHLGAVAIGKRDLCVSDTEGDFPEATQDAFDKWLAWAVQQ